MVSVIIPCHNNNGTINRAVKSVLNQSYQDVEILIIDNGSDSMLELKKEFADNERIKVLKVDSAIGVARARNMGVQNATGEYIAFLDADDYWAEDKLKMQLKVLKEYRQDGEAPAICFSGRQFVNNKGKVLKHYIGCKKIVRYEDLLKSNQINCSSVLMKRETALLNVFPNGNLHEDYAVWLKILKKGGYAYGINQPLLYYRYERKSRSGNKFRSAAMNYRVYRYMGFGFKESLKYMMSYTVKGIKKYIG